MFIRSGQCGPNRLVIIVARVEGLKVRGFERREIPRTGKWRMHRRYMAESW